MAVFSTAINGVNNITIANDHPCTVDITEVRIVVRIIAWFTKATAKNVT